ncbi:MAG: hypothetical protein M0Z51_06830 [Propionibacterium sp.]|nr:hypothetical protein [Propionibacterium sp.]
MPRITPRPPAGIVLTVPAGCLIALALAAAIFRAEGGRWFVISSPSMGRTAPAELSCSPRRARLTSATTLVPAERRQQDLPPPHRGARR